jgi:hypothetical protein
MLFYYSPDIFVLPARATFKVTFGTGSGRGGTSNDADSLEYGIGAAVLSLLDRAQGRRPGAHWSRVTSDGEIVFAAALTREGLEASGAPSS